MVQTWHPVCPSFCGAALLKVHSITHRPLARPQFVVTIGKVKSIAIVKDLKLHGTVRILLQPFHDQIPTFKAFSISFVGAPYVHMHTGSKGMPLPNFVLRFLSNFITDMVLNWFVWPLRIGPIVMATGVNYYDIDRRPTAVVLTRLQQVVQVNRSRIDPNKMYRLAVWAGNAAQKSYTSVDYIRGDRLVFGGNKRGAGERFELVLKEPEIETIKIALEQIEGSFGSKPDTEEIARYEVKIRDVIQDNPDEKEDFEINYRVPLTTADMGSRGGEVVGKLEMGMILNPQKSGLDSDVGSVYVKVVTIAGIPRTDLAGWADPYFKILIADKHGTKEVHRSPVRKCRDDRALTWFLEESTAMQIRIRDSKDAPIDPTSRIILELYDDDPFKDQLIGKFEMTMTDLVEQHAGFVTDKFTFYGECEAKLQEWPPSEDKRKWTDSWYKPYEREYVPVQGKPNMMQCKLELEAIFSWLGYH